MSKLSTSVFAVVGVAVFLAAYDSPIRAAQHAGGKRIEVAECGVVELVFDHSPTAYSRISFGRTYSAPPLVLVSECYSAGNWIIVKAENISPKECTICAVNHWNGAIDYRATAAYVVLAPEDIRRPPTQFLNLERKSATSSRKDGGARVTLSKAELERRLNERIGGRVARISISGTGNMRPVVIDWNIREYSSREFVGMGAIDDVENMLEVIAKSGLRYSTIRFEGKYKSIEKALRADYSRRVVDKIDWSDVLFDVREFADAWHAHAEVSP